MRIGNNTETNTTNAVHKNGKNYTKKLNIMKIFGSIDKIVELL